MVFNKEDIQAKYVGIIDFGTYKIRVGICKMLNKNIELIGYGEKRQDNNDIDLREVKNHKGICENIKIAINKAETNAGIKAEEYVMSSILENLFFEANRVNYERKNKGALDEKELYKIFTYLEATAFRNSYKRIENNSGYSKNDLKLIINNISNIRVNDEFYTKELIGLEAEEIDVSIINIFTTENNHRQQKLFSNYLGKNITNIIPTEYALLSLFSDKKNVVIMDLGNLHFSIIVKKNNYILGAKRLSFGMNDLIKSIRANNKLTRSEIIKQLETSKFAKEKKTFLDIFRDIVLITLEDILRGEICPNNFFLAGGGANKFIKDYLEILSTNGFNFKISKKIEYIEPKVSFVDDKMTPYESSNINIYAMIKASLDIVKKDKSKLEKTIKKIVLEINPD